MKIYEGYNLAIRKYGREIADQMVDAGMPKSFIDTACRFYIEDGIPIEILQDDFKKWNRYVLNNNSFTAQGNNNLDVFKSYSDFKRALLNAMKPFICPNPIYNDGNLSIGELKTQKDARWFPIQNLAFPDSSNDFCVSKSHGGYQQFQKYRRLGYRMLIIYDKSKSANDEFKRALVIARDGHLDFWNNFDLPCGTTKKQDSPIWGYIDSLPYEAQNALSEFADSTLDNTNESKIQRYMKNRIKLNESALKNIIAESIKKILNERNCCFKDYGKFTLSPCYDFCEDDAEDDVLKECGIKPEYKVICSITRIHEDPVMYDRNGEGYPGYDGDEDFEIVEDGGFKDDMERVKSVNPALYEKVMSQYLDLENTPLYDSIKWESDGYYC